MGFRWLVWRGEQTFLKPPSFNIYKRMKVQSHACLLCADAGGDRERKNENVDSNKVVGMNKYLKNFFLFLRGQHEITLLLFQLFPSHIRIFCSLREAFVEIVTQQLKDICHLLTFYHILLWSFEYLNEISVVNMLLIRANFDKLITDMHVYIESSLSGNLKHFFSIEKIDA